MQWLVARVERNLNQHNKKVAVHAQCSFKDTAGNNSHSNHHNDKGRVSTALQRGDYAIGFNQPERDLGGCLGNIGSKPGRFADHGYCSLARTTGCITWPWRLQLYDFVLSQDLHIFMVHCPSQKATMVRKPSLPSFCAEASDSHIHLCLGVLLFHSVIRWFADFLIQRFDSSCRPTSSLDEHDDSFRASLHAHNHLFYPSNFSSFKNIRLEKKISEGSISDIIPPSIPLPPNIWVPLIRKMSAVIKIEGSLEEAGCIIASPEKRLGASQQLSKTSWCCCTRRATGPEHCQWGRLVQPGQGLCQNSRADRPGCRAYHNTGAHKVSGSSQNSRQAD